MNCIDRLFTPKPGHKKIVPLILAPMAGITDLPFRRLARRYGVDLTVSEMVASQAMVRNTPKSHKIAAGQDEDGGFAVQIAGADPEVMVQAARMNVDRGAQIIDVNMGCPVKKIIKNGAGAALLKDEKLVGRILAAVVNAVDVPVTVKMRLGWDAQHRNGLTIAHIAEESGVRMLTVHGRTRADMYRGQADWQAIGEIKAAVGIPVIGNGDVTSPESAKHLLNITAVDGIMIGRGSLGRPWIFRQIGHFLATGEILPEPGQDERQSLILQHFDEMITFYGAEVGNRAARKHLAWHTRGMIHGARFRDQVNRSPDPEQTLAMIGHFFDEQSTEKLIR